MLNNYLAFGLEKPTHKGATTKHLDGFSISLGADKVLKIRTSRFSKLVSLIDLLLFSQGLTRFNIDWVGALFINSNVFTIFPLYTLNNRLLDIYYSVEKRICSTSMMLRLIFRVFLLFAIFILVILQNWFTYLLRHPRDK